MSDMDDDNYQYDDDLDWIYNTEESENENDEIDSSCKSKLVFPQNYFRI